MIRWRLWMATFIALVALVVATRVEARVFKIRGFIMGGSSFDFEALGKRLYGAIMDVDGREVGVSVIRAEGGGEQVAEWVRNAGGKVRYAAGDAMGLGEIKDGGKRVRLLALPLADGDGLLVVTVNAMDTKTTMGGHPDRVIAGVPVYRAAVVKRVLHNRDTGTTFWQAATVEEPGVVMDFYRSAFASAGWLSALPDTAPSSGKGLACFVKGPDLCWVFCRRVESDGETWLTLVNKRGGLN